MYGKLGRIGLLAPTGNSVMEPEFYRMAPEGVSTHTNRVLLKDVTPPSLLKMEDDTVRSAKELVSTRVNVIAFGCTSGSFVGGEGYDGRLINMIEESTGLPATTTTTAVVKALRLLKLNKISLVTPYTDEVTKLEVDYLQSLGFEVTKWKGGGLIEVADMQECEPDVSYSRAVEVNNEKSDGIFISCTGFRTIENIEKLELKLGKPVVTSNQATFADCLRIMGVKTKLKGYGSLFELI